MAKVLIINTHRTKYNNRTISSVADSWISSIIGRRTEETRGHLRRELLAQTVQVHAQQNGDPLLQEVEPIEATTRVEGHGSHLTIANQALGQSKTIFCFDSATEQPMDGWGRSNASQQGSRTGNAELGHHCSVPSWQTWTPVPWEMAQRPEPQNCKEKLDERRRRVHFETILRNWFKVVTNFKDGTSDW